MIVVMAKRPEILHEQRHVRYDEKHWKRLWHLRTRAAKVMSLLVNNGMHPFVYGSLARGDVSESSDIDIVIPYPVPSYRVELAVGRWVHRELVQATPSSVLKAHLHVGADTVVTFPLFKMMSREEEFYRWGGMINLSQLRSRTRVPGVDKRLLLIIPVADGHLEEGVIGREHEVARRIGVSVDIAMERVRVLLRRSDIGRTGVYLDCVVPEGKTFEEVAKDLCDSDPALRRTMTRRGG